MSAKYTHKKSGHIRTFSQKHALSTPCIHSRHEKITFCVSILPNQRSANFILIKIYFKSMRKSHSFAWISSYYLITHKEKTNPTDWKKHYGGNALSFSANVSMLLQFHDQQISKQLINVCQWQILINTCSERPNVCLATCQALFWAGRSWRHGVMCSWERPPRTRPRGRGHIGRSCRLCVGLMVSQCSRCRLSTTAPTLHH
jgi:hypothetical protein